MTPVLARSAPEALAGERFDVAVVGAGLAGSAAARLLAQNGHRVALLEKRRLPQHKVCGCCLNARALAHLNALGLQNLPATLGGRPLARVHLAAEGRTASLPLPGGMAVSRYRLDAALANAAAAAGVTYVDGVAATISDSDGEGHFLALQAKGRTVTLHARLVLAADGLHGSLLRQAHDSAPRVAANARIGAGAYYCAGQGDYAPGVIYMATGAGGYVGLVRTEGDGLDVAAAFDPGFVRAAGGLERAARHVLDTAGLPPLAGEPLVPWRGTPTLTRQPARRWAYRMLAVGDAAGYIEPFTGEGMAWALGSAHAVVPAARRAHLHWHPGIGADWERLHARAVQRRQWICRAVAAGLRRPRFTSLALNVLALQPAVARPAVAWLNARGEAR